MTDRIKVFFHIDQDEDGYPGIASESVWALTTSEYAVLRIDNIPFFSSAATLGDTVRVQEKNGSPWFEVLVHPCEQSLFRVVFFDTSEKVRINRRLIDLGCQTEYLEKCHLLAVAVPGGVTVGLVQEYLVKEASLGTLDYEEAILRG